MVGYNRDMSAAPKSTRRDFLQGRSAADALLALGGEAPAPLELPESIAGGYLLSLARRAMACQFEFFFNAGQYRQANEAGLAALDLVDRLEDQLSVFREHSEINRLNRHSADEPIEVEPRLFALLQKAVEIFKETGGAYDVTAGPLSHVWGFTRRAGRLPDDSELAAALARVGSQLLELDAVAGTIHFAAAQVEINLGSIGKGYALDRCAETLTAAGVHDYLLHGGNSSVLARGTRGAETAQGGWLVGLRDPLRPKRRLGQLRLKDRALATSGSAVQFFVHEGRHYGHILDPRTGRPAEGVLSASVLAPSAAEADALSTAFYVLGPEGTAKYCAAHPAVAALLLVPGEREGSVERHAFGLTADDWIEAEPS